MIAAAILKDALRGLAYQSPDMQPDHVDAVAQCLLALLPGATYRQWLEYSHAHNAHYELAHDDGVPDEWLDDEEQTVIPRDVWRDVATQRAEQQRDDALDMLMAHHSTVRIVRQLVTAEAVR